MAAVPDVWSRYTFALSPKNRPVEKARRTSAAWPGTLANPYRVSKTSRQTSSASQAASTLSERLYMTPASEYTLESAGIRYPAGTPATAPAVSHAAN